MQTTLNDMEQMKNALKKAASWNSFQIEAQVLAGRGEGRDSGNNFHFPDIASYNGHLVG